MASVPAETDKRSHSANVFFVHSVGKGCDRQYRRLQTSEEHWPCRVTPPLICVGLGFLLLFFFHESIYCPHTYCMMMVVGVTHTHTHIPQFSTLSLTIPANPHLLPVLISWSHGDQPKYPHFPKVSLFYLMALNVSFLCDTWFQLPSSVRSPMS